MPSTEMKNEALMGIYGELCKSYHAIDDFRMKLLGFLPLTSLVGIFGLSNVSLIKENTEAPNHIVVFIGVFAAAFTLALFIYEIRGILRCHTLIVRGRTLEDMLGIQGQFFLCSDQYNGCDKKTLWIERNIGFFCSKFSACVIYSTVFAAWIFLVLKFGFGFWIYGCAITAVFIGIAFGIISFLLVRKLLA